MTSYSFNSLTTFFLVFLLPTDQDLPFHSNLKEQPFPRDPLGLSAPLIPIIVLQWCFQHPQLQSLLMHQDSKMHHLRYISVWRKAAHSNKFQLSPLMRCKVSHMVCPKWTWLYLHHSPLQNMVHVTWSLREPSCWASKWVSRSYESRPHYLFFQSLLIPHDCLFLLSVVHQIPTAALVALIWSQRFPSHPRCCLVLTQQGTSQSLMADTGLQDVVEKQRVSSPTYHAFNNPCGLSLSNTSHVSTRVQNYSFWFFLLSCLSFLT